MSNTIYVASTTAIFQFEGRRVLVQNGKTTVREGHPILKNHDHLFRPIDVDYEVDEELPVAPPTPVSSTPPNVRNVEEATDTPEEPRRRGRPRLPRDSHGNVIHEDEESE